MHLLLNKNMLQEPQLHPLLGVYIAVESGTSSFKHHVREPRERNINTISDC